MTDKEWEVCREPSRMVTAIAPERKLVAPLDRKWRLFAYACSLGSHRPYSEADEGWKAWLQKGERSGSSWTGVQGARFWCGLKTDSGEPLSLTEAEKVYRADLLRDIFPRRSVVVRRECGECHGRGKTWEPFQPDVECSTCGASGTVSLAWLTEQVKSLAQAALDNPIVGTHPEPGKRTVSQVLEQRSYAVMGGCCNRFAEMSGCDCLELATPDGTLDPFRLSLIADALEEAGCEDDGILFHLRGIFGCDRCKGAGYLYPEITLKRHMCPKCGSKGLVKAPCCVPGCAVLDALLGME